MSEAARSVAGVYLTDIDPPYLRRVPAPAAAELPALLQAISKRIGRRPERKGVLLRDEEDSHSDDATSAVEPRAIKRRVTVSAAIRASQT